MAIASPGLLRLGAPESWVWGASRCVASHLALLLSGGQYRRGAREPLVRSIHSAQRHGLSMVPLGGVGLGVWPDLTLGSPQPRFIGVQKGGEDAALRCGDGPWGPLSAAPKGGIAASTKACGSSS